MYAPNLGDLQSILVSATRCLDCADPRCVNICPERVDVRAAMRLIVDRGNARPSAWMQREGEATASAMRAIEASFEF
jgi:ferredoxin